MKSGTKNPDLLVEVTTFNILSYQIVAYLGRDQLLFYHKHNIDVRVSACANQGRKKSQQKGLCFQYCVGAYHLIRMVLESA